MTGKSLVNKRNDMKDWFYEPSWKRACLNYERNIDKEKSKFIIFADDNNFTEEFLKSIKKEYTTNIVVIKSGLEYIKHSKNNFEIDINNISDYEKVFNYLKESDQIPTKILHLWGLNDFADDKLESYDNVLSYIYYSLLNISKAIGKLSILSRIEIDVITHNLFEFLGNESIDPIKSVIVGPVKTIPKEYENISCKCINISLSDRVNYSREISYLLKEVEQGHHDITPFNNIVLHHGFHRWVQTYDPVKLRNNSKTEIILKPQGVYLITGCLGSIGLSIAEYLAKTVNANIILLGRSFFPAKSDWDSWLAGNDMTNTISQKILKLKEIELHAAELVIKSCDVADEIEMKFLIDEITKKCGKINGIIHSAGIADGSLIQLRSIEDSEAVFRSKIKGTLIIDKVIKGIDLDFYILCSSLSSILSPLGQVAYNSANAFLDSFAYYKTRNNTFTVSIDWDAWKEVGMAVESMKKNIDRASLKHKEEVIHEEQKLDHYLFNRVYKISQKETAYEAIISPEKNWFLNEHRLYLGKAVMPGTAYLEVAYSAIECLSGLQNIELKDVCFLSPLIVENGREVRLRVLIINTDNGFNFTISSKLLLSQSDWDINVSGEATIVLRIDAIQKPKLDEIQKKFIEQEVIIFNNIEPDSQYGPRWNNKKWRKYLEGQELTQLELRDEYISDIDVFKLHPALLDMSTSSSFLEYFEKGETYLPFTYKRLIFIKSLPKTIYSYIVSHKSNRIGNDTLKYDISLFDENGNILVIIEEFTRKKFILQEKITSTGVSSSKLYEGTLDKYLNDASTPTEGLEVFKCVLSNE